MAAPAVLHLLGRPAAGKLTVAKALVARFEAEGRERLVLVDNHLVSDAILAVAGSDGVQVVGPDVWREVDKVRAVVHDAIATLGPPGWSYVLTNVVHEDDPKSEPIVRRLRAVAAARGGPYVPVLLHCDRDELLRRVVSPERRAKGKWVDAVGLAGHLDTRTLYRPDDPNLLELDVTTLAPEETAARVIAHLDEVRGG